VHNVGQFVEDDINLAR